MIRSITRISAFVLSTLAVVSTSRRVLSILFGMLVYNPRMTCFCLIKTDYDREFIFKKRPRKLGVVLSYAEGKALFSSRCVHRVDSIYPGLYVILTSLTSV